MIVTAYASIVVLMEERTVTLYFTFVTICFSGLMMSWIIFAIFYVAGKRTPVHISMVSCVLVGFIMLFAALPVFLTSLGTSHAYGKSPLREYACVSILKEQEVGIYDVKVVNAEEAGELVEWLNSHGYGFSETDRNMFDDYIKRGWCFVTTRVNLDRLGKEGFTGWSEYVRPLVVLFDTPQAVYPLALTGVSDSDEDTEVVLYVFSRHKVVDDSSRFSIRYAKPVKLPLLFDKAPFEPVGFSAKCTFETGYVTKLTSSLSPERMKKDLLLKYAPDDSIHKETVCYW
jgi:hypothetical protein